MGDLREEIECRLRRLLAEPRTAGEAADWAVAVMESDAPELEDAVVWDALDRLGGADLRTGAGAALHGAADFRAWLAAFQGANDRPGGV
ncbi:DNA-binding protein [Streptomyces sp. NPDC049881]|uniref:DNA-binding protein n=1 Tax=unclassified Streptomyces TaxID=2593676 RepID=UPI0034251E9C